MSKIKEENVALVYVELPDSNFEQDLYELRELISTAQGKIVLNCSQKRNTIDANTVVGKGKLDEIAQAIKLFNCEDNKVDVVIFSCNLNSTQRATLKKQFECDVIDKFDLILDIFALRATSAEGKKQVELAQLSYNLATKPEGDFSRQGAGIGTRGPGETKLETNKRIARERIYRLRQELAEIEKRRNLTRKNRTENDKFVIALVGYTNAGKSTLFNGLTGSDIYADDKLFATLDTTVRKFKLDNGIETLICDTVGFINELPHTLLNAFKSTLEEAATADLLLNVCDVSDPNVAKHIEVTERTLAELNTTAPLMRVYNKCDKLEYGKYMLPDIDNCPAVFVSALTGKNIDVLRDRIADYVMTQYSVITVEFELDQTYRILPLLNKYAATCDIVYSDTCGKARITVLKRYVNLFADYIVI